MEKLFCAVSLYSDTTVEWPTSNFNDKELEVVKRFISELQSKTLGMSINKIAYVEKRSINGQPKIKH